MSLVTVITDASLKDGVGGWAGRIIVDGQRFTYSGPLKTLVNASHTAELMAVANTLGYGIAHTHIQAGDYVILQVDNIGAHKVIEKARIGQDRHHDEQVRPVAKYLAQLFMRCPVRLDLRHVKAHKSFDNREARHHVHEAMDRLAKQERKNNPLNGVPQATYAEVPEEEVLKIACPVCLVDAGQRCYHPRRGLHQQRRIDAFNLQPVAQDHTA